MMSPNDIAQKRERLDEVALFAKEGGWFLDTLKIEIHEAIGSGASADIYLATWHGLDVALKCINPDFFQQDKNGVKSFLQEVELLARLRHPFIIRLLAASFSFPDRCWIVMEYMPGGTLAEWLHGDKKRQWQRKLPLPAIEERFRISLEIAQAMQYIHEQDPVVVHRDLKPSNIFMDDAKHVRLADFGCARYFQPADTVLTGETGTFYYMAPEVILHNHYSEKCDVYSYGVLLNEIMSGEPPYIDTYLSPMQIAKGVSDGDLRPTVVKTEPHELVSLITAAWSHNPDSRPSFTQITREMKSMRERILLHHKAPSTGQIPSFFQGPQQLAGWLQSMMGTGPAAATGGTNTMENVQQK